MSNAELEYENEIKRMQDAISRTKSSCLKRDYLKAINRMKEELEEYRLYRYGRDSNG